MSQNAAVNVELRMTVQDGGATPALEKVGLAGAKAADQIGQASQRTAAAIEASAVAINKAADAISQMAQRSAQAQVQAADQAATAIEQAASRQRTAYERMSHAREVLGVRSEQTIQREIDQTTAAYQRLQREGNLSADEQARHYGALQQRVQALTNEMGRLTAEQQRSEGIAARAAEAEQRRLQRQAEYLERIERGRSRVQTALTAGAAVVAGAYTLKAPMQQAMSFDEQVGLLANTAFAERDARGRKLGEADIRAAVSRAIDTGMTMDQAMLALDKLVDDNQVGGIKGALELLPYIGKVSTGSGSASQDVSAMMGSFIGSGYAKDVAGAKRLMGISSAAATAGAFEKGDMAKHLPALLPRAQLAGLTGEEGFRRLLVLLQQARTTAGSSDEAANNVLNLLNKLQSNDTAKDFDKAGRGDLAKYLMQQRAKGVDPLTAWQNVIESEIARNPNLQPALAQLQGAKTKEEQDAAIEAIKGMAAGQSMGKFFQDMQAQGALFGLRNKKVEAEVGQALRMSGSIVDRDYQYMADKAGVKARVYDERKSFAKIEAMDSAAPALGKLAEAASDVLREFPLLSGATVVATGAITAMAAAAGGAAILLGGGKIPGSTKALENIGKITGPRGPTGQKVLRGVKAAGLAGTTALVGGAALDAVAGEDSAISRYGSKALNGMAVGATVGSVIPVIGTGVGAAIGAAGGLAWEGVKDILKPQAAETKTTTTINLGLPPGLVVTSQHMQTSGPGTVRMNTGNIHTGAP